MIRSILTALLLLSACDEGGSSSPVPPTTGDVASQWSIGPVIDGKNYSVGMPEHPSSCPDEGLFCIDMPVSATHPPASHIHYVTFHHGPLMGKSRIVMRYRVVMADNVRIVPRTGDPDQNPSEITLYFQRAGDDWQATSDSYSGRQGTEDYRWYATFATQMPITAGEHEMVAPLDGPWTAAVLSNRENNPGGFADAVANTDNVGFVLGGGDGYGHGVYATGPARLIVEEFKVE